MPLKKSAREFWEEFMRKNHAYQTEIYKGHNPVFIPFTTNVQEYEDRYKYNTQRLISESMTKE